MSGATEDGGANISVPPPPPIETELAIELIDVCKSFGSVQANRDISMRVARGTIHGIVGENGAGKSTLMNILFGLHTADSGTININGKQVDISSSADAMALGIGMVHQHFMLVPNFTVLENVMLGTEGGALLKEGKNTVLARLEELSREFGMDVDPHALIEELPVGIRQRVEIIKAIKGGAEILILDEPTGVLTPQEAENMFSILRVLREKGVTVILITHKLAEIMAITDAVSIMRSGSIVGSRETSQTTVEELAELMVGRQVLLQVDRGDTKAGEVQLQVDGLGYTAPSGTRVIKDISFDVRAGEILGVAGVAGNGQTELLEILTGMKQANQGRISLLGSQVTPDRRITPYEMRQMGVGHIPEDRHHHGLVLNFEASENIILGFHHGESAGTGLLLDRQAIRSHCAALMSHYDVRPQDPGLLARMFSGGNQQKLVIAREIHEDPKLLIVGQPTRGVDIGAIEFIHKQLIKLRDAGCAILLVSVELDEIMGLSDRIMVMNDGRNIGIIDHKDADERTLGMMMGGVSREQAA